MTAPARLSDTVGEDRWPLVYIAGPYTTPDPVINARRAVLVAERVELHECALIIPHLSLLWQLISPAEIDDWYARDLRVLDHCDALVRFDGPSIGADREVAYAREHFIPTFTATTEEVDVAFLEWRDKLRESWF